MFSGAGYWAGQEDDELDGLGVHGFEVHGGRWATDGEGGLVDAVAFAVGDGQAVSDAGGAGLLAGPDGVFEGLRLLDFIIGGQEIDELIDRGLLIRGRERGLNTFDAENFGELHSFLPWINLLIPTGIRRYYWLNRVGSRGEEFISFF